MKKILLFFIIAVLSIPSAAEANNYVATTDGTSICFDDIEDINPTFRLFNDPNAIRIATWFHTNYAVQCFTTTYGDGHYYMLRTEPSICPSDQTLTQCLANFPTYHLIEFWKLSDVYYLSDPVNIPPPPPSNDENFSNMIASSTEGFSDTFGFDILGVVNWSKDNIFKLFIGSAFGIIYELRWWLAVAGVLGAILIFVRRAFRFHRA